MQLANALNIFFCGPFSSKKVSFTLWITFHDLINAEHVEEAAQVEWKICCFDLIWSFAVHPNEIMVFYSS